MPTSVRIPVQLRTLTGGQEVITGTGGSVLEIIEDIDRQYPGLKDRICESEGKVRRFVNIFLNEEDIRFLENLQTAVTEKDELSIIPAIAGGSPHFSPGGVIMAQAFFPQRVLASEERSGHYGRASMDALRGKGQARARPAPCVTAGHPNRPNKVSKIKAVSF